ncbi:helix-turn-helix domain-containing protein [Sphingomonas koreensis]|uniref:XRE family transcriptional regulator n=1 Tax=Sphingomonas koreensis TaxID=93064 RepID=A0A1L6J7T5_9SPHN|nr:helix-turn-helix transcriptional regulator [Sphingomonas koreensis]APR52012.1 hypothetical protein BRX40_05785 [Sphingomonas koreensis]
MSTTLDAFLDRHGIKDADFAPRIGRDRSMVSKLRRGVVRPTIDLAATIERETGGEVTMQSWVGSGDHVVTDTTAGAVPSPGIDNPFSPMEAVSG